MSSQGSNLYNPLGTLFKIPTNVTILYNTAIGPLTPFHALWNISRNGAILFSCISMTRHEAMGMDVAVKAKRRYNELRAPHRPSNDPPVVGFCPTTGGGSGRRRGEAGKRQRMTSDGAEKNFSCDR